MKWRQPCPMPRSGWGFDTIPLSKLSKRCEEAGLIHRNQDLNDRRRIQLQVTAKAIGCFAVFPKTTNGTLRTRTPG